MALKIERGISRGAVRCVIYGIEGIGKSTLAARFPNPVVLDTEDGTGHLDVARFRCRKAIDLHGALVDLSGDPQGFKTVVIDSADWAERMILEHMLEKAGKKSIEDFGFGKGYTMLAEHVSKILKLADQVIDKGVNVVFVAHATTKRVSPPDATDGFDRYELKLTKSVAPLFKEWADLLLFCQYRVHMVEGNDGRMKAKGGKDRIMHAEHSAAWDAKNRFGLPAELPMTIDALAPAFGKTPEPHPAGSTVTDKPLDELPEEPLSDRVAAYIAEAKNERALGKIAERIETLESEGQLTSEEAAELREHLERKRENLTVAAA